MNQMWQMCADAEELNCKRKLLGISDEQWAKLRAEAAAQVELDNATYLKRALGRSPFEINSGRLTMEELKHLLDQEPPALKCEPRLKENHREGL